MGRLHKTPLKQTATRYVPSHNRPYTYKAFASVGPAMNRQSTVAPRRTFTRQPRRAASPGPLEFLESRVLLSTVPAGFHHFIRFGQFEGRIPSAALA